MIGLSEENPLLAMIKQAFRPIEYQSRLYIVHWDDALPAIEALDDRPIHVELATL
jgi:hypothetical protein